MINQSKHNNNEEVNLSRPRKPSKRAKSTFISTVTIDIAIATASGLYADHAENSITGYPSFIFFFEAPASKRSVVVVNTSVSQYY